MGKKTKKAKVIKTKSSAIKSLSPQALAQSADSLYSMGDYKSALSRYERLYRENPTNESHKKRLIHCLLERSLQLSEKQMYVEACALMANLRLIDSPSLPMKDYLNCLVKARYFQKALKLCVEENLDINVISSELVQWLAAASMNLTELELGGLFQQDLSVIQRVFLYLNDPLNTTELLALELKKISLRSPFKDFRLVIQALLFFKNNQAGALKLAHDIQSSSPFFTIAQVIVLACQSPLDLFMGISHLSPSQMTLLQILKGWESKQLEHIVKTANALLITESASAAVLNIKAGFKPVKWVASLQSFMPKTILQPLCFSLYDGKNDTLKVLSDYFGQTSFIRTQWKALAAEKKENPWDAVNAWNECISAIKQVKEVSLDFIGAIRLHQYQLIKDRCCIRHDECIDWLQESLEYFPLRKETYSEICHWYKEAEMKKLASQWEAKMLKLFPKDLEVLFNTATTSLHKKTYTKALSVLQKILKIDSINVRAKQLLACVYFEKIFFEIKKNKINEAENIVENLKSLKQYFYAPYLIFMSEAFVACARKNFSLMKEKLNEAYQQAENKLSVNYWIRYYIHDFTLPLGQLKEQLVWDLPDETALTTLTMGLRAIREHMTQYGIRKTWVFSREQQVVSHITAALKYASNKQDFESLCDLFCSFRWYNALTQVAEKAKKQYKGAPLFNYYYIQGKNQGDARVVTEKQYQTLVQNMEDIENLPKEERFKVASLIGQFLSEIERYRKPSMDDFFREFSQLF